MSGVGLMSLTSAGALVPGSSAGQPRRAWRAEGGPVGQGLVDELAHGPASGVVVGADVAQSATIGGVVVHGEQRHLGGQLLEVVALAPGIDDADGQGLEVLLGEVVEDLGLLLGVA